MLSACLRHLLPKSVVNVSSVQLAAPLSTSSANYRRHPRPVLCPTYCKFPRPQPDDIRLSPTDGPPDAPRGPLDTPCGDTQDIFGVIPEFVYDRSKRKYKHNPNAYKESMQKALKAKPPQEWHDWDGFGMYKYRHHHFPNNISVRDQQRRRIFKRFAEDSTRLEALSVANILPKEIRRVAERERKYDIPRPSQITKINRRCTLTGRARGIFHQFRVSRMVFRAQADYNKVSGVRRADWMYSTEISP